jgi:hypothetical protein
LNYQEYPYKGELGRSDPREEDMIMEAEVGGGKGGDLKMLHCLPQS